MSPKRNDEICSENNPFEFTLLNSVEKVASEVVEEENLENLISITDFNKLNINYSRLNFFGMLTPMNRQQAK